MSVVRAEGSHIMSILPGSLASCPRVLPCLLHSAGHSEGGMVGQIIVKPAEK
jgi:hypothetical protein